MPRVCTLRRRRTEGRRHSQRTWRDPGRARQGLQGPHGYALGAASAHPAGRLVTKETAGLAVSGRDANRPHRRSGIVLGRPLGACGRRTIPVATAMPQGPRKVLPGMTRRAAGPASADPTPTWCLCCRPRSPQSPSRTRRRCTRSCPRRPPRRIHRQFMTAAARSSLAMSQTYTGWTYTSC